MTTYDHKYGQPKEFIKLKWIEGIDYGEARRLLKTESSDELFNMLADLEYFEHWGAIARLIGYVSQDRRATGVLLDYVRRQDDWGALDLSPFQLRRAIRDKTAALIALGHIGGTEAKRILGSATEHRGAHSLVSEWIDDEIVTAQSGLKKRAIDDVRGYAAKGLIYHGGSRGKLVVRSLLEQVCREIGTNTRRKKDRLYRHTVDALIASDLIAKIGLELFMRLDPGARIERGFEFFHRYECQ